MKISIKVNNRTKQNYLSLLECININTSNFLGFEYPNHNLSYQFLILQPPNCQIML